MRRVTKILLLNILSFLLFANCFAQTDTAFWFCIPQVTWQHEGDVPRLLITATDQPAKVTIEMPMESRFETEVINIPKNTSYSYEFNKYMQYKYKADGSVDRGVKLGYNQETNFIESGLYGESCIITNKGIHIKSTALITAYLERGKRNNDDIWALKGQNAFGTYFIVPSQNTHANHQFSGANSVEDPGDWNAIDIVAVEDCNVTVTLREAGLVTNFDEEGSSGATERTFTLLRGQTLNLQAASQSADKHLNGTIIDSDGLIAVQWKDDSVHKRKSGAYDKSDCGSYDLIGDQLVRTDLSGKEYIVMRGQLGRNESGVEKVKGEFVYLMSTVDETTTITAKAVTEDDPDHAVDLTVSSLNGVGDMTRILLNPRYVMNDNSLKNFNVVHITASNPIVVIHVSGFGGEVGGAILPTIAGCTGSTDVSVCRSTDEGFFLNIMCKSAHKNDFTITIKDKNGSINVDGEKYRYYKKKIDGGWFSDIPGTEWCYLNRNYVEFHKDGNHDFIVKTNDVVKVSNSTGLFHLAIINGGSDSGCRYGYFSDFSPNEGSAIIQSADFDSEYAKCCEGDIVTLKAKGGLSEGGYSWKYIEKDAHGNNIISDKTFINSAQMALDTPRVQPYKGFNQYQVTITRRCYKRQVPITVDGVTLRPQDTVINVWALGYPRAKSAFDIEEISECSPAKIVITNKTDEGGNLLNYTWTLSGGGLNDSLKSTTKNASFRGYGTDTLTFRNETDSKAIYHLTLEASVGSNCPDKTAPKDFCVNPKITAKITAEPTSGCSPLNVKFDTKDSEGPYTTILVDWGDGSGWIDTYTPESAKTMNHTYTNPSTTDTTYWAKIKIQDLLNGSCDSEDSVKITVFGIVKSQFIITNTSDCSPLFTRIQNTTIGDQSRINYTWEVGSPTSGTIKDDAPFTLKYTNQGDEPTQHDLQLTAVRTNKDNTTCTSVSPKSTVTVYPEFTVDYTVEPKFICDSSSVTFTNLSNNRSDDVNFRWIFGDGATDNKHDKTFDHLYYHTSPDVQEYETQLIGESKYGCRDTASNGIISVMPYLNPHFTISKAQGCSPLYVTLVNNTPGHAYKAENNPPVINCPQGCEYEIIDGSLNSTALIRFTNKSGSVKRIPITLTEKYRDVNMTYDCPKTFSDTITVYPEIVASIESDKNAPVCDSTEIKFTNNTKFDGVTTSPTDYRWTFGDGTSMHTSDNKAVTHIYGNTSGTTSPTAQHFTATLIATANGCADTATATVDVYPPVRAAFSSEGYNICSPDTVAIKNSSVGANKFEFAFDDGTATVYMNTLDDVAYIINNTGAQIATKKVTLTASNGECSSTISKTYDAYPVVVPKLTATPAAGCGPLDVTVDRQATTGASTFKIDFGDGISDETGRGSIAHTFDNKTGSDVAYTIRLTATNTIGCQAETTDTVTVYPEIKAAFSFEKASECSPMDVKMINNSLNGSKFTWTFGDGTDNAVKTTKDDFNHRYSHNDADGNNISTYNIKMVVVDANHTVCRDSATKPIQVYPKVIAAFKTENDEGCSPLTTTFTNQSQGYNLTYKWDFDHDNLQSAETNTTHTFDNVEAATRTYNVKLTVTDANNCSVDTALPVKAYPHVVAGFTYVKNDVCTPYPVTFSYPAAALNGNKFEWDFGFDGNKATKTNKNEFDFVFDNTELNSVKTYNIKLVSTDTVTGCTDNITKPIEVYPQLKPAFTQDVAEGCNPLPVAFTNQTTGLADYLWDFGDSQSSAETSPSHLFKHHELSDQTYRVVLRTTQTATGCVKTVDSTVMVYSYVLAKFGINETSGSANGAAATVLGGCHPFDVTITDSSRLTSAGTWSWDFGDGETSTVRQPRSRTYTNPDVEHKLENKNYTIKLVVTNDHGCRHDTAQTIAVYPHSVPDFDGNFEGCEPLTIEFADKSVVDSKSQYFWTFSDGSTIVDRPPFSKTFHNYDYEANREFTATLKTTTEYNCTDSITKKIVVYAKPLARFIPLVDRACPPFEAEFQNTSIGNSLTFEWDFGNGVHKTDSTTANEGVDYLNDTDAPITFNVQLVTKSAYGCLDTMVNPMITFPNVKVDFDYEPEGCSPHTINVKNKSSETVVNHLWDFGDGSKSVADAPTYTYYNTTDNDQELTITYIGSSKYQCTDTIQKKVTVYINPNVDFVADAPSQRYPDDTVYFINYTQEGPWKYEWDFGDGKKEKKDTRDKFMHKYGTWAPNKNNNLFMVTLNVQTEHCHNKVTHEVEILPPYPRIEILNQKPAGCVPLTVQFKIDQEYCNTFEWTFGENGPTSTEPEPEYTFTEPGIYNVKLTAEGDGGSHYDYEIITVHELPEPDFSASPKYVMLPDQPVQFFNASRNGNTYIWDFGDGEYSTDVNPYHQYTKEGIYDVKLIAFSQAMCVDSIIKEQEIEVSGAGYIKFPNAFLPDETSPIDGTYLFTDDNVFHPIWHGVKKYELWIFNRWGEQLFHSTDVNVGWNGMYGNNGTEMGQDVYFWKAKGKFENNVPFKLAGDVTLIRR